ncbi:MAG: UDP-N-acetylmuramoyl-L-alanine--D-glutamate ligase [Clostridia bacterium]|nr:UDP-N-acetylmuramoyl-L-alanine--D-glutamate ligase [Clostridia bacterium]
MTFTEFAAGILSRPNGRAVILGLGVSNLPLAAMLAATPFADRCEIRDAKPQAELEAAASKLGGRIKLIGGADPCTGILRGGDMSDTLIFRTPGIRPDSGELPECVRRGARLTSEMECFCNLTRGRIVAVTGSDGKTTTTTLTHLLLSGSPLNTDKLCLVGGNIGRPLLDSAERFGPGDTAVLELSSFQLMTMNGPAERAAITNITPNHLNWHTGMEEYTAAKYRVFGEKTRLLVLNAKNPLSAAAAGRFGGKVSFFTAHNGPGDSFESLTGGRENCDLYWLRDGAIVRTDGRVTERILDVADIRIPGIHNVENYMTAIALTAGMTDRETILRTAREFNGVEHRLEFVRELNGVKYYNSSIDSTPTRTAAALSAVPVKTVVICGGRDKHLSFLPLADALFEHSSAVVLTGEALPQIKAAIEERAASRPDGGVSLRVVTVPDFEDAVRAAASIASPGEAVVLSPACTSFDRFANFEERGRLFKQVVISL